MATKNLFSHGKLRSFDNFKNDNVQYSNLNLNGIHKTSSNHFITSESISNKNERKITDFTDNKNCHLQTKNNFKTLNIENLKPLQTFESHKIQQQWKKKESNSNAKNNNSTLSLHIAAYENVIISDSGDTADVKQSSKTNSKFCKTWKGINNGLNGNASMMDSFEIPRQQENQAMEPEIMQFKTSQKLLNLQEIQRDNRQKAGADPNSSNNVIGLEPIYATTGMNLDKPDPEPLIKNLWSYIVGYLEEQPPPFYLPRPLLQILREALAILQSEPTVIDLEGVVTIIGGVHGHGDSLMYHMSYSGLPPAATYVFLGNYVGEGFAPHECLFLLLALKVKYPKHIYLLKGCFEDPDVLKGHDFISGLQKRGLMDDPLVWCYIEQIMHSFPLAAILNDSYFLVSGGIGTELMKVGIPGLRTLQRPPTLTSHISITMECQWACLKLPMDTVETATDGSPIFTEEMITKFCAENKLRMIIRSRQLVAEGILNYPEQMITLWTPVSFLDSFRNASVSLRLNGENHKASIMRYQTQDKEPESLDDKKPTVGRNAMII